MIGTTGPEMTRFFFTVDEAVQLILTAMDQLTEVQGRVLSRRMKSALIEDILDVWVAELGGRWERIEGRPGERNQEYLVGELELEYTREIRYNDVPHYLISFNEKVEDALGAVVSSDNAERLTRQEIVSIISNPPEGEVR